MYFIEGVRGAADELNRPWYIELDRNLFRINKFITCASKFIIVRGGSRSEKYELACLEKLFSFYSTLLYIDSPSKIKTDQNI